MCALLSALPCSSLILLLSPSPSPMHPPRFMPNVDAALAESCRVLRPGGTFVAAVYQGEGRQPFFPFLGSLAAGGVRVQGPLVCCCSCCRCCWQRLWPHLQAPACRLPAHRLMQTRPFLSPCPAAEIAPEPESEQAEPSPYHPCRFGDPAPLLAAASAAGLADIECRELSLAYCLSADDWWPCLTSCGDMPVKAALERAAAAADCSGRDVGGEAQQLAERRMRERGWLQPDGSVFCPGNMAWFVVACKPH